MNTYGYIIYNNVDGFFKLESLESNALNEKEFNFYFKLKNGNSANATSPLFAIRRRTCPECSLYLLKRASIRLAAK